MHCAKGSQACTACTGRRTHAPPARAHLNAGHFTHTQPITGMARTRSHSSTSAPDSAPRTNASCAVTDTALTP